MKAWILPSISAIGSLQLAEVPAPASQAGEVILDVLYAALNPADRYLAEGQYPAKPPMPHILGRDGVGVVRSAPSAAGTPTGASPNGPPTASTIKPGQTMVILRGETGITRPGTFAEQVAVAADYLVPVPAGWTLEESAGASLVYLTAYQALTQWGELANNPAVVLITGASGGVGVASVQLARAMGHRVIALSRSPEKQKTLLALGADLALDPNEAQWRQRVKEFLAPKRVDLAIDNIGGRLFSDVLDTLGKWGKVSVVGRLAGPVPEFNTSSLLFRRLRVGGVAVGSYTNPEARQAWSEILEILGRTGAKPLVDRVFDFRELPAAFGRLAEGPMGKVLVRVRERS